MRKKGHDTVAQTVSLNLTDTLYSSVHRIAQVTDQSDETIILMILQSLLPALDSLSGDLVQTMDRPSGEGTDHSDKASFYRMLMQTLPVDTLVEPDGTTILAQAYGTSPQETEPATTGEPQSLASQTDVLRKTQLTLLFSLQR